MCKLCVVRSSNGVEGDYTRGFDFSHSGNLGDPFLGSIVSRLGPIASKIVGRLGPIAGKVVGAVGGGGGGSKISQIVGAAVPGGTARAIAGGIGRGIKGIVPSLVGTVAGEAITGGLRGGARGQRITFGGRRRGRGITSRELRGFKKVTRLLHSVGMQPRGLGRVRSRRRR